jgi:hypothetical protein
MRVIIKKASCSMAGDGAENIRLSNLAGYFNNKTNFSRRSRKKSKCPPGVRARSGKEEPNGNNHDE